MNKNNKITREHTSEAALVGPMMHQCDKKRGMVCVGDCFKQLLEVRRVNVCLGTRVSRMLKIWKMWHMRRRSRTICLVLAFITISLHLLFALVSFSINHQPCDPPLTPRTHILRNLANTNYTSVGISGPAQPPTDSSQRDSSNKDAKGRVQMLTTIVSRYSTNRSELLESGLSKLKALFDHPLCNIPGSPIPEEDWLLKVIPKVKASEKSSQMCEEHYENVQRSSNSNSHPPWLRFHLGISRWQLYPHHDPNMEALTQQLATHRVVSAVQKSGGTQLKLVMSFPNYGKAMVKPMKQDRNDETNYNLYYFSDFERHNAEIAAFHLDRILGYRRVPPVVGRLVDVVKEVKEVTTDHKLARTFFTSPVGNVCFYGQCSYYCSTEHAVCGRPRNLEASLAVMLPDISLAARRAWRSPWRRSYSRSKLAKWETEPDYCSKVKKTPPYNKGTRLVDFMDMVILDFLMSNMDRHHYETFEKFGNRTFLLHLDNGRAFGRHSKDEPSILSPLEQCCRIRRSTWLRLRLLSLPQYRLSDVMRASLSNDPLHSVAPLLSEPHLAALDRRLKTVLETVGRCQKQRQESGDHREVIYDD
uniref:extracellular serine/threonine protein kinase FAM20C-like n=1 Tax=Monopterus albus TaxID=43700 RepID=UPI0009B32970